MIRWIHDVSALHAPTLSAGARTICLQAFEQFVASPLVEVLDGTEDLDVAQQVAKRWRQSSDRTVVIGTGGASLGAQALVAASPEPERLVFLDNIDPLSTERVFRSFDKSRTSWLIASKSGGTAETLACTLALVSEYAREGMLPELSRCAAVITSEGDSPLRAMAEQLRIPIMLHPAVGGRYSVFTLVGLLPALLAGQNAARIRQGAVQWLAHTRSGTMEGLLQSVSWLHATMQSHPVHVVMAYADSLRPYTRWFQQLWAESLGKGGHGSTPYAAIGTIDQHSQLQLFLDGPRDKSFTLLLPSHAGKGATLDARGIEALRYLEGHCMGDVMDASAEATAATLARHGVSQRVLRCAALEEPALGELLLMHMAETVLVAALMGIDPYDQPAVEQGKKLTRSLLQEASSQKRLDAGA